MPKTKEKISECPPKIGEVINQANSLPKGFPHSLASEIGIEHLFAAKTKEQAKRRFAELTQTLPKDFFNHCPKLLAFLDGETIEIMSETHPQKWEVSWVEFERGERASRYERSEHWFNPLRELTSAISSASAAREGLHKIIELSDLNYPTTKTENKPVIREWKDTRGAKLTDFLHSFRFHSLNIVNGVLKGAYDFPFDVLIGDSADIRRIKNCSNCKDFFWLKRLNKNVENEFCKECSNSMRQKKFVQKNKDQINTERRRQRYKNDRTPYCEKCIRPNTRCNCYQNERKQK